MTQTTAMPAREPEHGAPSERVPDTDRLALTLGQRVAAALVGLLLLLLGGAGLLTSRLNGDAPGQLPPVALIVVALGLVLVAISLRGRSVGLLPARRPALLPQLVLTIGVVTLVAIGQGIASVRPGAVGRIASLGTLALGVVLVVLAVVRRWVPRFGEGRGR